VCVSLTRYHLLMCVRFFCFCWWRFCFRFCFCGFCVGLSEVQIALSVFDLIVAGTVSLSVLFWYTVCKIVAIDVIMSPLGLTFGLVSVAAAVAAVVVVVVVSVVVVVVMVVVVIVDVDVTVREEVVDRLVLARRSLLSRSNSSEFAYLHRPK
jgi:hypothetical protein